MSDEQPLYGNYYDYLELSIRQGDLRLSEIIPWLTARINDADAADLEYDERHNKITMMMVPWYSHDKDLAELSQQYPGVVFQLHGEGALEDRWNAYYKNGMFQFCFVELSYPPYDPEKLEPFDQPYHLNDFQFH